MYSVIPPPLWDNYKADPVGSDEAVRQYLRIPEDRYYSVTVWPEHLAGRVFITPNLVRIVRAKKISKSDQG